MEQCIECGEQEYDSPDDICHACGYMENPFECCGCPTVGAEYMGQQEMICCGNLTPR